MTDSPDRKKAARAIDLVLPWPPSVNRYWRHVDGRTLISREGRRYRKRVAEVVALERCGGLQRARVAVHVTAVPPDRRRRDLDNVLKALLDACTHVGVWDDDEQIDDLRIVRGPVARPGRVLVLVTAIGEG